jgi:hypothetical protein
MSELETCILIWTASLFLAMAFLLQALDPLGFRVAH